MHWLYLESIDVVRHLQLIQLLLDVGNHLLLELGTAQQVKGHTCQQHVDSMLNGYGDWLPRALAVPGVCMCNHSSVLICVREGNHDDCM